jgi:hypothetical protein
VHIFHSTQDCRGLLMLDKTQTKQITLSAAARPPRSCRVELEGPLLEIAGQNGLCKQNETVSNIESLVLEIRHLSRATETGAVSDRRPIAPQQSSERKSEQSSKQSAAATKPRPHFLKVSIPWCCLNSMVGLAC